MESKIKKKIKKPSNLPRYKSGWGEWKYFAEPSVIYYGGGLHYIDKNGKFVHAKMSETYKDIKPKIMTKTEFNKKFGHLLKDKEYMKFLKGTNALIKGIWDF